MTTFSAGGKGGQHQNTANTGVRITHDATGLSAEARDSKSQYQNKKSAFRKLAKMVLAHYSQEDSKDHTNDEVIRTYNEHHNYVRDEKSGKKFSYKHTVGKNDISELVQTRMQAISTEITE